MKPSDRDGVWFPTITLIALTILMAAPAAGQSSLYPTDYVYLDLEGKPLPFQDHETILEVLRTAPVVEQELMSRGVAANLKLVLEHEGIRFHAVLRMVDVTEKEKTTSKRMVVKYRDSYIFEAAAYELNEILGIGRIPPTTVRSLRGRPGSIQIWMEETAPEDIMLAEDRLNPPDRNAWWRQKMMMWVFDALIANSDRNQGNLLIDSDWNLWLIDHTRAFRETSKLIDIEDLDTCERGLWTALQNTDRDLVRKRLEGHLTSAELSKFFLRWDKLVKHFRKKIKKRGEDRVLYEIGR